MVWPALLLSNVGENEDHNHGKQQQQQGRSDAFVSRQPSGHPGLLAWRDLGCWEWETVDRLGAIISDGPTVRDFFNGNQDRGLWPLGFSLRASRLGRALPNRRRYRDDLSEWLLVIFECPIVGFQCNGWYDGAFVPNPCARWIKPFDIGLARIRICATGLCHFGSPPKVRPFNTRVALFPCRHFSPSNFSICF